MPEPDDTEAAAGDPDTEAAGDGAIDDIKAKMRRALESKQSHDKGGDDKQRAKGEKGPDTHGPLGGVHMHRRKAGGGGS